MSRVTLALFAAAAVTLTAAGSANAGGCCRSGGGFGFGYGYAVAQPSVVFVQPAPQVVTVQAPPVVVQVQQPPIVVQAVQPQVQQYVVNQGPYYSGPNLTDYRPAAYYEPFPARAYPYVGGYAGYGYGRPAHRWGNYGRPAYRPYGHHHRYNRGYHGSNHHYHRGAPLRRYN